MKYLVIDQPTSVSGSLKVATRRRRIRGSPSRPRPSRTPPTHARVICILYNVYSIAIFLKKFRIRTQSYRNIGSVSDPSEINESGSKFDVKNIFATIIFNIYQLFNFVSNKEKSA